MKKNSFFITSLILIGTIAYSQLYDPGSGNTVLLIGQTFQNEYIGYKNGVGLTPAGGSHYGTLYLGTIEQGDDDPNAAFLDYIRNSQSNPYALIALSIKDNTAAGGYGQMVDNNGAGFNSNAIWEALIDITNGSWNSQIDQFAQTMASRPDVKFYFRIGYEVSLLLFAYNGSQYVIDWLNNMANQGINVFENPDAIAEFDRHAYINAYNYIAQRIRSQASNVAFVYHPVRGFYDTQWLYPGSQYVDYFGFSIFNNDVCLEVNGTTNCVGQSIDPNLQQSMNYAQQQGKPIIIAEAAIQAGSQTNSSSGFNNYLNRLHNVIVNYDVRVLAYINSNWPAHGWDANWRDSRVEVNSTVLNHWKSVYGNGTRYIHSGSTPPNPTCSDGIQNQGETGVDCGGPCPPCGTGNWTQLSSSGFETGWEGWTDGGGDAIRNTENPSNGNYAINLRDNSGSASSMWRTYNMSSYSELRVDFNYIASSFENNEDFFLEVSTNGGSSYTTMKRWIEGGSPDIIEGSVQAESVTYSGSLGSSVRIRFRADASSNADDVYIDDVVVYGGSGTTTPTCSDGIQNQGETGVDCGGPCPPCGTGDCSDPSCPPSHPIWLCNQCWESEAQAASGGCNETCDDPPPTPTCSDGIQNQGETGVDCGGPCPPCPGPGLPETLNFENGIEDWTQVSGSDTHDWTIQSGGTPSNNTGPSSASQGSYYAYMETSSGYAYNSGDNARLVSPSVSGAKSLTFDYHMLGNAIGTLNVDVQVSGSWNNAVWSKSGSQGSSWQSASVDLSSYSGSIKVRFRAVAAGSWQGDIAIDDIVISDQGGPGPSCSDGIQNQGETGVDCGGPCPPCGSDPLAGAKLLPPNKKILSSIGQDLKTELDYINGGVNQRGFPTPGSVVTYASFHTLEEAVYPEYGALGESPNGTPLGYDINWGAGPLNARNAADGYPESALVIGLNIADGGDPGDVWCSGCLSQIGNGSWDTEIRALAAFCNRRPNEPIYLRIGFEFDGKWNLGYSNTTNFKNAWRRIVDVMRNEGVTNVAYVWQSCSSPIDDILEGTHENINNWWPGDSYVDWLGFSWFLLPNENPLVGGYNPHTQKQLADEVINLARSKNKPVLLAESTPQGYDVEQLKNCHISSVWDGNAATGCVNKSASQIWNEWYVPFFNYIYDNSDVIRQVTYINVNWEDDTDKFGPGSGYAEGYWGRAGVHVNNTIAANWKTEMEKSIWMHGGPNNNSGSLKNAVVQDAQPIASLNDKFEVYPNPALDKLYFSGLDENTFIEVFNLTGTKVMGRLVTNSLDISELENGMYILVTPDNQRVSFIKQ